MIEQAGAESSARRLLSLVVLLALAAPLAAQSAKKPDPPDALVERYVSADERTDAGRAERGRLLAALDAAGGPLAPEDVAGWSKTLLARWKQGRKLEKSSGEHWFWPDSKRGKYVIGGETKKPRGLYVGLHTADLDGSVMGASGGAALVATSSGPYVDKLKWLGLFPQVLAPGEHAWTENGTGELVLELIDDALRTWDIDRDHVVMGGFALGGTGTWMLGAQHADVFAALAPASGVLPTVDGADGKPADIAAGLLPNLRNLPLFVTQISDDAKFPPETTRLALQRLADARARWGGFDVQSWEVDARHDDATPGGRQALYDRFKDKPRDPRPTTIVWQPTQAWPRQFGWLWWEAPVPGALVQAELLPKENKVRVSCDQEAAGLCVLLDARLLDLTKNVVVELNGAETFCGVPEARLSTLALTGVRGDPQLLYACRVPVAPSGSPR